MTSLAHTAVRARAESRAGSQVLELLLFATVFVITFSKVRINVGGDTHVLLYDVTAALFVGGFLAYRIARRDWIVSRTVGITGVFLLALLAVYLVGFFNLTTEADRDLFAKGIAKTTVHFGLVICGIAYLERHSLRLYWQLVGAFVAGIAFNAFYGLCQLALAETVGTNLDEELLGRLGIYERGGVNVFGAVGDTPVYRATGLTLDPDHLGVMLVIPILLVLALYLRLERGHGLRAPFAVLLVFLGLAELATLSRSGLLGIATGLLVLTIPYRHLLVRPRVLVPLGGLVTILAVIVANRVDFFSTVLSARTQVSGGSIQTHLEFYSLIRPALEANPLFGLGLNTFSAYYEFVTGEANYGPHSYYVALLTETGIVGAAVYAALIVYVFTRLAALRRLGRALAGRGERLAARVWPLGWGLTAALVGTMVANLFYLTMGMYYFFIFLVLFVAAPVVVRRAAGQGRRATVRQ